jgi:hypothetical protein
MNIASSRDMASPSTMVSHRQPDRPALPSLAALYDRCSIVARRLPFARGGCAVWTRKKFGSVYVSVGRMLGFTLATCVARSWNSTFFCKAYATPRLAQRDSRSRGGYVNVT